MNNLLVLVKMQLKEKLNFKRFGLKDVTVFKIVLSILTTVLKFALVTGLCAVFLFVSQLLGLFSLTKTVPSSVISIVFSFMLLLSVISCTVGLTKSMYYSHDNAILLTLPCRPIQVYLSKLIIFFFFELKRNFSFMVPLFIAYFITHKYAFIFYPWLLVCFVFISLLTVAIAALLSIPAMYICNVFRQSKVLQGIGIGVTVTAATVGLFFAISLIPENVDILGTWKTTFWDIQDFINAYTRNFAFLYDITLMMLGETWALVTTLPAIPTLVRFLVVLGVTAAFLVVDLLLVLPMFYSMASKPFEYLKRQVKPKENRVLSRRVSAFFNDIRVTFKSPDRIFAGVAITLSVPMLIFLLNKIFFAMNTRELGNNMVIMFNILIILLIVLNSNCSIASIYSRDGRSSYLIKTQPSKPLILLLAKIFPSAVFVAISLLATIFVLLFTLQLSVGDILLLVFGIGFIYLAHMFYSAELDIMNPQVELYATIGSNENNPNEIKSTITAFLIAFITAAAVFLLLAENSGPYTYLKLFSVSVGVLLWRVHSYYSAVKLYYKEK